MPRVSHLQVIENEPFTLVIPSSVPNRICDLCDAQIEFCQTGQPFSCAIPASVTRVRSRRRICSQEIAHRAKSSSANERGSQNDLQQFVCPGCRV